MFRMGLCIIGLAVGFVGGVIFERYLMRSECVAGEGQWTGTICVNSELLQ